MKKQQNPGPPGEKPPMPKVKDPKPDEWTPKTYNNPEGTTVISDALLEVLKEQSKELIEIKAPLPRKEVINIQPGDVIVIISGGVPKGHDYKELSKFTNIEVYREQSKKMEDSRPIDVEQAKRAFRPHPEDREQDLKMVTGKPFDADEFSKAFRPHPEAREQVKDED